MLPFRLLDPESAAEMIFLFIILAAILQDDLTCITVGLLSTDTIPLPFGLGACFLGTLLGDLAWFTLGRLCGLTLVTRRPLKWVIKPEQLERAVVLMERYGPCSIVLSRFLPGIRSPLQLAIGTLYRDISCAVPVLALSALVYTLLTVGFAWFFRNTFNVLGIYDTYGRPVLLVAAFAVLLVIWLARRLMDSLTREDAPGH